MTAPVAHEVQDGGARAALLALAQELEHLPAQHQQLQLWAELISRWPNLVRFEIRASALRLLNFAEVHQGRLHRPYVASVLDCLARGEGVALGVCAAKRGGRPGAYRLLQAAGAP